MSEKPYLKKCSNHYPPQLTADDSGQFGAAAMTWPNPPYCCMCECLWSGPQGGIGPKRCKADPGRRDVGLWVSVDPETGQALNAKNPRPEWCPRVREKAA